MEKYSFGYKPEPPDMRDFLVPLPQYDLPEKVDWTSQVTVVKDQGNEGCHDEATEILTDEGWKKFSKLNRHEKVATVNPITNELEFQQPINYFCYDYSGQIYHLKGRTLDCLITPNHNLWLRKRQGSNRKMPEYFRSIKVKDLGEGGALDSSLKWTGEEAKFFYLKPVRIGPYTPPNMKKKFYTTRGGQKIPMDSWLKFLGLYLAEGWVDLCETSHYRLCIAASKKNTRKIIERFLSKLPFNFSETKVSFVFYSKRLYSELAPLGNVYEKFIPDYVKNLSVRQIRIFLDAYVIGDGYQSKNAGRKYYSTSKRLADDLLELVLKTGKWATISIQPPKTIWIEDHLAKGKYPLNIVYERKQPELSIVKKQLKIFDYNGKTHCVEVPNHLLLTRRNGKPIVAGNSCVGFAVTTMSEFKDWRQHGKKFNFSERWIYEWAKEHDEWPGSDYEGSSIRGAMKALAKHGICEEKFWPYIPQKKGEPDDLAAENAYQYRIEKYRSLTIPKKDIRLIKRGLHETGPIVAGIAVHSTWFDVEKDGIIKPSSSSDILGYHAILVIAYDDRYLKLKNSWGTEWGAQGFGFLELDFAMFILHSAWAAYDL